MTIITLTDCYFASGRSFLIFPEDFMVYYWLDAIWNTSSPGNWRYCSKIGIPKLIGLELFDEKRCNKFYVTLWNTYKNFIWKIYYFCSIICIVLFTVFFLESKFVAFKLKSNVTLLFNIQIFSFHLLALIIIIKNVERLFCYWIIDL